MHTASLSSNTGWRCSSQRRCGRHKAGIRSNNRRWTRKRATGRREPTHTGHSVNHITTMENQGCKAEHAQHEAPPEGRTWWSPEIRQNSASLEGVPSLNAASTARVLSDDGCLLCGRVRGSGAERDHHIAAPDWTRART